MILEKRRILKGEVSAVMERLRDWRVRRAAFREYARNGWESPWFRKNRFWDAVLHK